MIRCIRKLFTLAVVLVLLAALVCFLKFYAAFALGHSFSYR